MNEFGTPMNEAELSMHPNPGKAMLQEQLATSGMQNNILGAIIGAGVSLFAGSKAASAANRSADQQNEYNERKHKYDIQRWEYGKEQQIADRQAFIDAILLKAQNEKKGALFQDAAAIRTYNYKMQVRNREQTMANQSYIKSDKIYNLTTSMNSTREQSANEAEMRKLKEIEAEAAFDLQEAEIDSFQQEQAIMARGQGGRSTAKLVQSKIAEHGRKQAMLNQALAGARNESFAALKTIKADRIAADMKAYGAKMLAPGDLPTPVQPYATPLSDYTLPRELEEYDFGPEPVKGVAAVSNYGDICAGAAAIAVCSLVNNDGKFIWNN